MNDSAHWDRRYGGADYVWKTEPNRFLPPEVDGLVPGTALDVACGEGRYAVWLATQGWNVTGVDFSEVGLSKAAQLAASADVSVEWVHADVTSWDASELFDLVVVFYLQLPRAQRREAFARAWRALAPGGTLLVVGHDLSNLSDGHGGPQDAAVLYTPDDVVDDLAGAGGGELVVERAERVNRPVDTDSGQVVAIDCLVRAHRPNEGD